MEHSYYQKGTHQNGILIKREPSYLKMEHSSKMEYSSKWNTHQNGTLILSKGTHSKYLS